MIFPKVSRIGISLIKLLKKLLLPQNLEIGSRKIPFDYSKYIERIGSCNFKPRSV